ncbi:hypothetical protein V5799_015676 [Amblyomma americanum]|uniref:Uncharacterized protein n=1 Tax=Amblyomma americanum TaxID=6943 RepID=A0AAQ4F7Y7_AMBAM
MRKNTAPGPDRINTKMLFNMDDISLRKLVKYFNTQCWNKGQISDSWKLDLAGFIHKPKKPCDIDHLRPISLTSCLGKLFERVVNARLKRLLKN